MKLIYVPAPVSDNEHSGGHTDEDERGEEVGYRDDQDYGLTISRF